MKKYIIGIIIISAIMMIGCTSKNMKILEGTWVADPKNQSVVMVDENTTRGGKENYFLTFSKDETFTLKLEEETIKGTFTVNEKGKITLKDEDDVMIERCQLMGEAQLQCDNYASSYTKEK